MSLCLCVCLCVKKANSKGIFAKYDNCTCLNIEKIFSANSCTRKTSAFCLVLLASISIGFNSNVLQVS